MSDNKKLPKRSEVPQNLKWRIEDIYPDKDSWEEDYQYIKDMLPKLVEIKGTLGESAELLLSGLNLYMDMSHKIERLFVYAKMKTDEDNGNSESQALLDRAMALLVEGQSAASFIVPEIIAIPEGTLEKYISSTDGLKVYDQFLYDIGRRREHTLSVDEEKILAMAGEVAAAPGNIFTMLNNADIRFPAIKDENGEDIELTKGRYTHLMQSSDRRVRQDAFKALYDTYSKQRNTIAATLSSSIKKDIFISKSRKYSSDLDASLDEDNISVSV